jgi:hypothetical protein
MDRQDVAFVAFGNVLCGRYHVFESECDFVGISPADVGQDNRTVDPVKQLDAGILLQQLNLMADC